MRLANQSKLRRRAAGADSGAASAFGQLIMKPSEHAMDSTPAPFAPEELERFRAYLALLARLHVSPGLRDRVDLSGVVQQTLLEAHQELMARSRERTEAEMTAWLRSILSHNLADGLRKLAAQKRDARRDRSLSEAIDESSSRLGKWLVRPESSPSQKVMRQEQMLRIAEALARLPENQRRAIELHHLQGQTLAEIAQELSSTKAAVAGLLHRGLKSLRTELAEP
jgi:RNA polymerase sigma-70 factor (ECF subfamily)